MNLPRPPLAIASALLLLNFFFPEAAHDPTPPALAAAPAAEQADDPEAPEIAAQPGISMASQLVRVASGDTLMTLLVDAGVASVDAQEAVTALKPVWNPRALRIGQEIALHFAHERLQEMRLAAALDRDVIVARGEDGHFASRAQVRALVRQTKLATGTIRTTLFEAASDAGVPMSVLADMIHAFSYDVDFQREVHPGDSFEVLFERLYDDGGKAVGAGEIAYASMTLSGSRLRLYHYMPAGTKYADFFNARGESVRKALLRTPVDGARLSSGFGMRHHPILGYTKMHRGVDFAAPPGTPIMAAGDGVVKTAAYGDSYGNLVVLRHNGGLETAYAHMSHIARAVIPGKRVHQGEVIGYVGATGRATGPHLHYEVRIRGEATNPMSVKMQPGQQLAGKELTVFLSMAEAIDHRLSAFHGETTVAAAASPAR